jgi:putative transposase
LHENLMKQDFTAERLDQTWLTDLTYIVTPEGWLYLAADMELRSRRIDGSSLKKSLNREVRSPGTF